MMLVKEINIYSWRKRFLCNIDSRDEKVIVIATIATSVLQNKTRKKNTKENFSEAMIAMKAST